MSLPGTASFPPEPVEATSPLPQHFLELPGEDRRVSALGREGYSDGEIKCLTAGLCSPSW